MVRPSASLSTSSSVSVQLIETRDALERIASQWNILLNCSEADCIFLTWEWIASWIESVFPEVRPFVIVVYVENHLVGIAPFYLSSCRLLNIIDYSCIRLLGDCHSGAEYPDIILEKGYEKIALPAIASCFIENREKWDCAYIPNVAGWTGAIERLTEAFSLSLSFFRKRPASFSCMTLPETFDEYQLKTIDRKVRQNIRRHEKRLSPTHDINWEFCASEIDLPEYLDDLFQLHAKRWESLGQTGSFVRRPLMKKFYQSFSPTALRNGWLKLSRLKVDGSPLALQYGYQYKTTFLTLQGGFDPTGPTGSGIILRHKILHWCIENGLRTYDFLGEHTPQKQRWGAKERFGCHLFLGNAKLKNIPLARLGFWPSGRFIKEGFPANQGTSHD